MSGLAAIVASAADDDQKIHVYYSTAQKNLGVTLRSGKDKSSSSKKTFVSGTSDTTGQVPNPSQLGATVMMGMSLVVGITDKKTAKKLDVSIVSPVYRPLAEVDEDYKSISVCSTGQEAWVYYLKAGKLHEQSLDDFSTSSSAPNDDVLKTSSLAAYCVANGDDDTKRYVIYQGTTNSKLYERDISGRETTNIADAGNPLSATPLAVLYNSDKKTTYLYYVNTDNKITRIKKTSSGWGSSHVIDTKVDPAYQITAVWSDGVVHLFYVADGKTDISTRRDHGN